jgi:hypothetical protein
MAYVQVIEDVLKSPLPDPRSYQPSIPEEAVRVIEIATAKDPEERFRNTREMAEALDTVHMIDSSPPTIINGRIPGFAGVQSEEIPQPESMEVVAGVPVSNAADPEAVAPSEEVQYYHDFHEVVPDEPEEKVSGRSFFSRRRTLFVMVPLLAVILGLGAYALTGGFGSLRDQEEASTEMVAQPMAIAVADSLAGRFQRGRMACAIGPVTALYASDNMQYLEISNATREDVEREIAKLCARVERIESFTVRVDTVWGVPGAVEALWTIESVWRDRGGERLRDSMLDRVRIEKRVGEWVITEQRRLRSFTERFGGKKVPVYVDSTSSALSSTIINNRSSRVRRPVVVEKPSPNSSSSNGQIVTPDPTITTPDPADPRDLSTPEPQVIESTTSGPQPNDQEVSRPRRSSPNQDNKIEGKEGGNLAPQVPEPERQIVGPQPENSPPDTPNGQNNDG